MNHTLHSKYIKERHSKEEHESYTTPPSQAWCLANSANHKAEKTGMIHIASNNT